MTNSNYDLAVASIRNRKVSFGFWNTLPNPYGIEQAKNQGYDYICLDTQHGFLDKAAVLQNLLAIGNNAAALPVVRASANNLTEIGWLLDAGARGLIVPLVNTAKEAAAIVAAVRYPDHGGARSFGQLRPKLYQETTPDSDLGILVLPMIETKLGYDNLDEILAVPGVDGIYVGPADLSYALGFMHDADADSKLDAVVTEIAARVASVAKVAGVHTADGVTARRRAEQGFTFITVISDHYAMYLGAAKELRDAQGG